MLCGQCLDLFKMAKDGYQGVVARVPIHQPTPKHVKNSARKGCMICKRLWQLHETLGELPYWIKETRCMFEDVEDQLIYVPSTIHGRLLVPQVVSSRFSIRMKFSWGINTHLGMTKEVRYRLEAEKKNTAPEENYRPSKYTNSPSLWKLVGEWINECRFSNKHAACNTQSYNWAPTRLLDLKPEDSAGDIKLIVSKEYWQTNLPMVDYTTLSHCWGKTEVIKLTDSTIQALKSGILMHQLPKLYREAIIITRRLGLRYIWIDSLCIIQEQAQNASSDWIKEAAMMGKVYSNSFCNIAAMDAEDSLGECFFQRKVDEIMPHKVNVEWHTSGSTPFQLIDERSMAVGFAEERPLSQRAWVFQEQLLPPRALLFGKTQVYWQCRTHMASETFPNGLPEIREGQELLPTSAYKRPVDFLKRWISHPNPLEFDDDARQSQWEGFWFSWKTVVEDYTRRSLSFPKDKLAAIAGVAAELECKIRGLVERSQPSNPIYIAGLWNVESTILYELLWKPKNLMGQKSVSRPAEYIAPSWSWASVVGPIEYEYKRDYDATGDRAIVVVEDVEVITIDGTPTGPIKSGSILINGRVRKGRKTLAD